MARALARIVNACLAPLDLALVRRPLLERLGDGPGRASYRPVGLPPGAEAELRFDNPRVRELERRYAGHPAAQTSEWSSGYVRDQVPLPYFRGDSAFVWQQREGHDELRYVLTALYAERYDDLGLLDRLTEDGSFGVHAYEVDGRLVSRDLLDSVAELSFLEETLGLSRRADVTILDIGAGYGRFADRATAAFANVTCLATDAVPLSTFLCEYYLASLARPRAEVVPLDVLEGHLRGREVDLAVNIHSFPECPLASIEWWLDLLVRHGAKHLLVVPNVDDELLSTEPTGEKLDFRPAIEARGFRLLRSRPKYHRSEAVQRYGVFPVQYLLFGHD